VYNGVNAIRGGIPIVFRMACFFGGEDHLTDHLFLCCSSIWSDWAAQAARICSQPDLELFQVCLKKKKREFSLYSTQRLQVDAPKDEVALELTLQDNETTKQEWNGNQFTLVYTIVLGKTTLATHLSVENKNEANAFSFTTALHTYFAAEDIHKVSVRGLKGKQYTDKMRNGQEVPTAERISLSIPLVHRSGRKPHVHGGDRSCLPLDRSQCNCPLDRQLQACVLDRQRRLRRHW